jgi:hypothetical protein
MAELKGFYRLPPELRDQIYTYYLSLEGGYLFDYPTKRLTNADGSRIDLSLRLISHRIADETRSLALKSNAVHITTFHSDELRVRAGYFKILLDTIRHQKSVRFLKHATRSGSIDAKVAAYVQQRFPRFVPVL